MNNAGEKINRGIQRIKWNRDGREKPNKNTPKNPESPKIIKIHPTMAAAG